LRFRSGVVEQAVEVDPPPGAAAGKAAVVQGHDGGGKDEGDFFAAISA
jgi:hypothetical protein